MPADPSRRLGLHAPSGGDPADVPADTRRLRDQLDGIVLAYDTGVLSSRAVAGVVGRAYWATDTRTLYLDTGAEWLSATWQPGMVQFTAAQAEPPIGWLAANGRAVRRADYPALFDAIGITHGAGDGRTTFLLPDFCGRVPVGAGATAAGSRLTVRTLGVPVGAEAHTLILSEIPSHAHVNTTGIRPGTFIQGGTGYGEGSDGDLTGSAGGDRPHNNMQPSLPLNAWIKT